MKNVNIFIHISKDSVTQTVAYIVGYCDLQYAINFDTITRFASFNSVFDTRPLRSIFLAIQKLSLKLEWDTNRFNEVCHAIERVAFNGCVDETAHLVLKSILPEVSSINIACANAMEKLAYAGTGTLLLNSNEVIELHPIQAEDFSAVDETLL